MANYYGMTRTNYFRVTDPERLRKIISATVTDEDSLQVWTREYDGETLYAFGGYCSITGVIPNFDSEDADENADPEFDEFDEQLRRIVDPNDAIIITEIGYEKLRYLTAESYVITAKESTYVDLWDSAADVSRRLLNNPEWCTHTDY